MAFFFAPTISQFWAVPTSLSFRKSLINMRAVLLSGASRSSTASSVSKDLGFSRCPNNHGHERVDILAERYRLGLTILPNLPRFPIGQFSEDSVKPEVYP